jgi:GNAT superfamily N-acetyltransferase
MGSISFEAVKPANQDTYMAVGTLSYRQHYTHLWERGDPSPYLASSFTAEVVAGELSDSGSAHFIVTMDGKEVGILKIIKDCPVGTYSASEALLIEKIYLLNNSTGRGIGAAVLEFAETYARQLGKKVIWLDTMQKGPALHFYLKHDYRILEEHTLHYTEVLDEERPMYILIKSIQESGS